MSDFTVFEDVIADGVAWMTQEGEGDLVTATFAYPVDIDEVKAKRPEAVEAWFKFLDNESFCEGDELHHEFASLVRGVAEERGYNDFKQYVQEHEAELPDPCRRVRVVINNPNCLPSADERRRREGEELGRLLGRLLGLGKR